MFTSTWLTSFRNVLLGYRSKCIYKEFSAYMENKYNNGSFWPKNNRGVGLIEMERLLKKNSDLKNKEFREEFFKDLAVGKQVLHHYMSSSYQGWDQGSSLIFWRWPSPMRKQARDGIPPYIKGPLPTNMKRSRVSSEEKPLIWAKLCKYLKKGYLLIKIGNVITNVIDYFSVKKGEEDIRVVYNGVSCGLNTATWCSNFWLPTSTTLTCLLLYDYKVVDVDI